MAKLDGDEAAEGGETLEDAEEMDMTEWLTFSKDCKFVVKHFERGIVEAIYMKALSRQGGTVHDREMALYEFLEAIVRVSFKRANPHHGEYHSKYKLVPLPGCLQFLLQENIYPLARRDTALATVKCSTGGLDALRTKLRVSGTRGDVTIQVRARAPAARPRAVTTMVSMR